MLARKTATTLEAHHAVETIKQALEKFGVPEPPRFAPLRRLKASKKNKKTFIGDFLSHFATIGNIDVYGVRNACVCNHTMELWANVQRGRPRRRN